MAIVKHFILKLIKVIPDKASLKTPCKTLAGTSISTTHSLSRGREFLQVVPFGLEIADLADVVEDVIADLGAHHRRDLLDVLAI
jgi:hypothetical protein